MATLASNDFATAGIFTPAGVILACSGNLPSDGWLQCDGQAVARATYPQLLSAISTTYNTQMNPITGGNWADPGILYFRVPDYRGVFLRNTGTPSGLDTVTLGGYQIQRTGINSLSVITDGNHAHNLVNPYGWFSGGYLGSPYSSAGGGYHGTNTTPAGMHYSQTVMIVFNNTNDSPSHGHVFSGDNETRPINKGIYFIIKV